MEKKRSRIGALIREKEVLGKVAYSRGIFLLRKANAHPSREVPLGVRKRDVGNKDGRKRKPDEEK